jgi:hypothetical protein
MMKKEVKTLPWVYSLCSFLLSFSVFLGAISGGRCTTIIYNNEKCSAIVCAFIGKESKKSKDIVKKSKLGKCDIIITIKVFHFREIQKLVNHTGNIARLLVEFNYVTLE